MPLYDLLACFQNAPLGEGAPFFLACFSRAQRVKRYIDRSFIFLIMRTGIRVKNQDSEHVFPPLLLALGQHRRMTQQDADSSQVATVVGALQRLQRDQPQHSFSTSSPVEIHILGADEKELPSLDSNAFAEKWEPLISFLRNSTSSGGESSTKGVELRMLFAGPNMPLPRDNSRLEFAAEGNIVHVVVSVRCGLYHELEEATHSPHLAVAFNAGLWGYDSWLPTIRCIFENWGMRPSDGNVGHNNEPHCLLVTSYTLEESDDDYDTLDQCFESVTSKTTVTLSDGVKQHLMWNWENESNPFGGADALPARPGLTTADGGRVYRENQAWQCVSVGSS